MELENVIDIDVELKGTDSIEVDMKEAGPPGEKGEPGLSAYEVYQNAGGTLTEVEWLDSLKGEPGKDGKTPIKGDDYWTNEDIEAIEKHCNSYIDNQLGLINEELASLTTLGGE